jgi:two-component system, sensor histidine kinase and response regulator
MSIEMSVAEEPSPDRVFDLAEALLIVDGDRKLFREIAQTFVESCPEELSSIRDAIARQDPARLRVASHHLKGSLSALAAREALETAKRLEQMGRNADLTGALAAYDGLERQTQALAQALNRAGA